MPTDRIPQPSRHKASGQGVVRLSGKDHYLGPWPANRKQPPPDVRAAYERLVAEWLSAGRRLPEPGAALTVNDLILRFVIHCEGYYPPAAKGRGELYCVRDALRPVKEAFGRTPAAQFGPKALKAVRERMVDRGWSRSHVNHQVRRVVRMFRWAVTEELAPASVYEALRAVPGLRRGTVRESEPVGPVPAADVEAVLPLLPPAVAAVVRLQRLTGARPGEILSLRAADLETTGRVWVYRPRRHKTAHLGRDRIVLIGPKGQEVLRPWLRPALGAYVFSPASSEAVRQAGRGERRRTKPTPSERARRDVARRRARPLSGRYTTNTYAQAVARACVRAGVPKWSPNQLRHARATELRREHGLEVVKAVLGHATVETSQIYAQRDLAAATAVIERVG
jgi:integrase